MKKIVVFILCYKSVLMVSAMAADEPLSAPNIQTPSADILWLKTIEPLIEAGPGLALVEFGMPTDVGMLTREMYRKLLREKGLKFHQEYPFDSRWVRWFFATMKFPPFYSEKEAGGEQGKVEWEQNYKKFRTDYFASKSVSREEGARLWLNELWYKISTELNRVVLTAPRSDAAAAWRAEVQGEILELAAMDVDWDKVEDGDRDIRLCADFVFDSWQDDRVGKAAFLQRLSQCENATLRDYATGRLLVAQLANEPLRLGFKAIDGRDIDLGKLKGKVVLIQYWATSCIGCVAQIPKLERVYDKYHAQGFEIIGLSGDTDIPKVAQFAKKSGMTWPQRVDPVRTREEYKKYGFTWEPNFLLLDKEGHLVMFEAPGPTEEKLESLVRKHLGLSPLRSESVPAGKS